MTIINNVFLHTGSLGQVQDDNYIKKNDMDSVEKSLQDIISDYDSDNNNLVIVEDDSNGGNSVDKSLIKMLNNPALYCSRCHKK